ncbi:hypothetical protein T11_13762 [Trichinella zimbabwensis]|uniref:Uncharacterized protein n=1 Tax=Trichinella zimbabwensis TaxID=268475 RepID=A0A0V1I5D2_9BILA|nr:hypothetical protein T11_13762 [Trichinella zimbabwensis]
MSSRYERADVDLWRCRAVKRRENTIKPLLYRSGVAWTPPLAQYHRRRRWDKRVSLAIDFSFLQKSGRRFELANLTVRTDAQRCRPSLTNVPLADPCMHMLVIEYAKCHDNGQLSPTLFHTDTIVIITIIHSHDNLSHTEKLTAVLNWMLRAGPQAHEATLPCPPERNSTRTPGAPNAPWEVTT